MPETLPFQPPFDAGIFAFLAARAVTGVEEASGSSYARTLALPGGHAWFRVDWDGTKLTLDYEVEDPADAMELVSRVRALLDLDHDPLVVDGVLSADPLLAPRVAGLPGMRLPGCVDPAEILIRAMIGQQITVAAARTALNQLTALSTAGRVTRASMVDLFPSPAEIATGGRDILRGPQRRIDSIIGTAALLADGSLTIGRDDTPGTLAAKLLPLPGIGPWTVGYVSMRVLGSRDIFLPTDAAVRNGYGRLRGDSPAEARKISAKTLDAMAEPLRPWRSYATMHLWRVAGEM